MQAFKYRDTVCLEHELYDENGKFRGNRNSNKRFRKCGSRTRKTFNRFITKDSCINHHTESIAAWKLKPEWLGSPFVQHENFQEEWTLTRNKVIIVIIAMKIALWLCYSYIVTNLIYISCLFSYVTQKQADYSLAHTSTPFQKAPNPPAVRV